MSRKFHNPINIIFIIVFVLMFIKILPAFNSGETVLSNRAGEKLLAIAPKSQDSNILGAGIPNAVTAVVVYYRGLDTLGEVSVLFLVATAVGMLFGRDKSTVKKETNPNEIVSHAKTLVLPHFLLTGLYIIVHGHLTPGGGFQGGVMAAGMALLLLLSGDRVKQVKALHFLEGIAGSMYVLVALAGLWLGGSFLGQYLPLGGFNRLFSGGILPIIYIFVGIKVGTEITSIYQNFQKEEVD